MTVSGEQSLEGPVIWPSVNDASPGEEGGPIARIGFSYQDEVAVGFLIEMLCLTDILQVHCETHDDILIVRCIQGVRYAEYVQVKAAQPDQLWSVANLCLRKSGAVGSSIFEVSLARDKHLEPSKFRLVTHRPVVSALGVLTYPFGAPGREAECAEMSALHQAIGKYCPEVKSKKGNDVQYWTENCLWDVRNDQTSIATANQLKLLQLSVQEGQWLLPEQAHVLLEELRAWVKRAGEARWASERDKKIITRTALCDWWKQRVSEIRDGASVPGGGKLSSKLDEIGAAPETIALAIDIRRGYAALMRTPKYMAEDETAAYQQRVKSEMMRLRARFSAGHFDVDGAEFLAMCLERLDEVNDERPAGEKDLSAFLQGCMYDITDRCLHRFARPVR